MSSDADWYLDYFEGTVREVFGEYMEREGFDRSEALEGGTVVYRRPADKSGKDVVLEIEYWPEDAPEYPLMVSTGVVDAEESGPGLHDLVVGLWALMPDDDPARAYGSWRFRDEASLKRVLARVQDEVVERHAKPAWDDPSRIELGRRRAEAATERDEPDPQAVEREEARKLFEEKQFRRAYDAFAAIDSLTELERRKMDYARKHS